MTTTNETRRNVMLIAWSFRRAEAGRSFADCLRGAWAWIKNMTKAAPKLARRLRRSRNGIAATVRSAAWDRSSGHPYRGAAFGHACSYASHPGR